MPEELNRAGHLFCELNTESKVKGKKLILIGH
jgi:glutamate carboxypeptidase